MKLGCIFTVTMMVGCLAGEITESTGTILNGGLSADQLEKIEVKCNEQSYAQVEYPGIDPIQLRGIYVVGVGDSCNPPTQDGELGPEQVGRLVRVFCPPYNVVRFERVLR